MEDRKSENSFTGHKLNGSNYRLWKFQLNAYMRARALTDNVEGKVPEETASNEDKALYERNEGKAMNAIIQSVDVERANLVLMCTTTKQMVDKLSSVYEKNSEIRVMTLYEEYFSLKMQDGETIAGYVSKVNQLASEIEAQGEKLSDKLKMVRIISSLPQKFNNYKTVWYNTKETRTIDTMMSSLQLEEDNLSRMSNEECSTSDAAFVAKSTKTNKKKLKPKINIDDLKKKTKCHNCDQVGHWSRECPKKKSSSNAKTENNDIAWCSVVHANKNDNDESNFWFADSGASSHMTYHREWFSDFRKLSEKRVVEIADEHCLDIVGTGTILIEARVNNQWETRRLENVLYVPQIKRNLISTAVLTDKGMQVIIQADGCKLIDKTGKVVAVGERYEMNQLKMDFRLLIKECANTAAVSLQHWHRRLGHINIDTIKKMCKDNLVTGIDLSNSDKFFCEDCQLGKMTRSVHKEGDKRPSNKGEYFHADLCGPMEEIGVGNFKYFLLIKDEATSFRFVYLIKSKDEVFNCLNSFILLVHNMNGARIKYFRCDNGTEFINKRIKDLLAKNGIQIEYISPYTPEQNGLIERDNRTVQESARTMLIASGLHKSLWPEAVRTAAYLLNRSSSSTCTNSTPYEKWFDVKPSLGHVKIFGTECFVQIPKQTGRKKWDPKAKKVNLVGYEPTIKNFRLYDPSNHKIIISCDVKFNEIESKTFMIADSDEEVNVNENIEQDIQHSVEKVADNVSEESDTSFYEDAVADKAIINDNQSAEPDQRNLRSNQRYGLRPAVKAPERLIEKGYSAVVTEPKTYDEAIQSPDAEKWKCAMDEEYSSLIQHRTWNLVEPPRNQKVIDNRWVFKVKQNTDGSVDRYKARLVVRGFTQQYGVDYEETFSPVVKFTSIRTILALAAVNKMQLKQFDIKTAFLCGDLSENVYMKQPIGYDDNSGRVCKLVKSLYGLKQASRCFNQKFTSFIHKFDLKTSVSDPCVFVRHKKGKTIIVAIYVDDGLVASNDTDEINSVLSHLQEQFEVKVMEATCFLGLQIEKLSNGSIHIHQEAYIKKILNRFNMAECKTVSTPIDCGQNLGDFVNDEIDSTYPYREAVGSLMFLAIGTRPDISYAIGVVSRYLEHPSPAHVNAVKRIFKYIRGTVNMGIFYNSNDVVDFVGYSDADYAGDNETRRSTSGYVFHIGSGVISWASTRQKSVSTSSTESEYIAACQAVKELVWIKQLVAELSSNQNIKAKFYMDNQSAIRLVKNPVFHKRTKHIDVQYHFIREKFQEDQFELEYINTDEQVADILTKGMNKSRHNYLCDLMNLKSKVNN